MEPNEKPNEQNGQTPDFSEREENRFAKPHAEKPLERDFSFESNHTDFEIGRDEDLFLGNRPSRFGNGGKGFRLGWWIAITAVLVAVAILLTFTLTFASSKKKYTKLLDELKPVSVDDSDIGRDAENLKTLESILRTFSFYADTMDAETMLQSAFKAYVAASGDRYAVFYTEAEYLAMSQANSGQYVGIGVSIRGKTLTKDGDEYLVFSVVSVLKDSPAANAGICVGDCIFAIVDENGIQKTITELGSEVAISKIKGEVGTTVDLVILRPNGDSYDPLNEPVTCTRAPVETISAEGWILDSDPSVAVVRISSFDLNTPTQFQNAVDSCLESGATKFVFDVRGNLGGDLRSVRAILSNFLQEGDLILKAIDKDGNVSQQTKCEAVIYTGTASGCSVSQEQIGRYRNLDFVVLCNEKTASAAEVFTATLRDFELSRLTVGQKTFGKGIMQTIFEIPFNGIKGYVKLTTHSYVTQCGESYHEKGIEPDVSVKRSEGTENIAVESLIWEQDIQLQTAVLKLTAVEE